MFLSREKEDDDEFIPNPNVQSNLAAIFGSNANDGNPSLVYSAPKQPKPPKVPKPNSTASPARGLAQTTTPAPTSSTRVIIVKQVQSFRLVETEYKNQGRVSAVLNQCSSANEHPAYQLLLNKDRRTYLCNMRVVRDFNYHVQPKNYVTFYTDKIVWSILFDSPSDLIEFSLQVAVARWRCGDQTSAVFYQDLWCPSSDQPVAAVDHTVDLLYSLHTLTDCSQDCEEGSGAQRVSVTVESSGWTQALVNTRPTTKRVLFLQPFMLGDLNPTEAVHSSPAVVRLTVLQVSPPPPATDTDYVPKLPPSLFTLPSVPETVSDSVSIPQPSKADLITRMARMGQPLPFKTAAPTPSDSDDTEEDQSGRLRRCERPRSRVQPITATPPPPAPTATPAQVPVPVQWVPSQYMVQGGLYGGGGEGAAQFNMFLSEVRTTNSELRMGLTRLTDKVDTLQNKLGNTDKSDRDNLSAVVERLLNHEQQLNSQLEDVKTTLRGLQETSIQPPAACQRCATLHTDVQSLQEKLKKLEEENEYLKTNLSAQRGIVQNTKLVDREQVGRIAALTEEVETSRSNVSRLTARLTAADLEVKRLRVTVAEQQQQVDQLEQKLADSENVRMGEVHELISPAVTNHVKAIYSIASRAIKTQFHHDGKYDYKYINQVFSQTVRGVTLEYLEREGNVTASDMDLFNKQRDTSEEREDGASASGTPHSHLGDNKSDTTIISSPDREDCDQAMTPVDSPATVSGQDSDKVDYILSNKLHSVLLHITGSQTRLLHPLPLPPPPPPSCYHHHSG